MEKASGQPPLTYEEFACQITRLTGLLLNQTVTDPAIVEAAASSADLLSRAHPSHAEAYQEELERIDLQLTARAAAATYWLQAPDIFNHSQQF